MRSPGRIIAAVALALCASCDCRQKSLSRLPLDGGRKAAPVARLRAPSVMDRRPVLGPSKPPRLPTPRRFTLKNGVAVFFTPKRDLALVKITALFGYGVASDDKGLGALAADMLDEGAGSRDALGLSAAVEQLGAKLVSRAGYESTELSLFVLSDHLDAGLPLLADVILRPRLLAKDLGRVKKEQLARAIARRAKPSRVASLVFRRAIFGASPFGRSLLALPRVLRSATRGDMTSFHRRMLEATPRAIAIAGDISEEAARAALERFFGGLGPSSKRRAFRAPRRSRGPRLVMVHRAGAPQSVLRIGHRGPGRRDPDYATLRVLNTLLGGSFTSRLNQNLRERRGYTYGVRSTFSMHRAFGAFVVATSVKTANTAAAIEQVLLELSSLRDDLVSSEELRKAKRLVIESLPARAETLSAMVDTSIEIAQYDLPVDDLASLAVRVEMTTPRRLRDVARKWIDPSRATIVVVGDTSRFGTELQKRYGKAHWRGVDGERVDMR